MEPSIVLGHLALHYRPGNEQPARRLLQLLGCTLVDNGPAPGSDGFCTVLVDKGTANHADNVMFLSKLPPAQVAVEDAIGGLAVSETDEGDLVATLRGLTTTSPESLSHIGMRPVTLLSAIWLQFALAVTLTQELRRCEGCGKAIEIGAVRDRLRAVSAVPVSCSMRT